MVIYILVDAPLIVHRPETCIANAEYSQTNTVAEISSMIIGSFVFFKCLRQIAFESLSTVH